MDENLSGILDSLETLSLLNLDPVERVLDVSHSSVLLTWLSSSAA